MTYDYKNRGYLLPEGCKDLIDVLQPRLVRKWKPPTAPSPLPPVFGEITVAEQMSVLELAVLLKQKPYRVLADLMELRVLANVDQQIDFEMIARVVQRYGYTARKAA